MIVTSVEHYVPVTPGYLTLQDSDGVYYYVHRTFYEQAVILNDRYGKSIDTLQKLVGGDPDYVAIEKFVQYVPAPLNIMGYFLALLQNDIEDFEDIIGAMDTMAEVINLRALIQQPAAIRQQVSFNMEIDNIYRDRWDLFFHQCYEYDWMKTQLSGGPSVTRSTRAVVEEEPEEESSDDDLFAQAMAEFNSGVVSDLEALDKKEDEEKATDSGLSVIAEARNKRRKAL